VDHFFTAIWIQSLSDVIFTWLNDKNLFTLAALKNSQNAWLSTSVATKKKDVGAKCFLCTRMTFSQSRTVMVGISELDHKHLTLINPRIKTNEVYHCNMFLSQQLLSAIRQVSAKSSFSKTVPHRTGSTIFLTLIFHKVV